MRATAVGDTPELDAQLIACHGVNITRGSLYAFPEKTISPAESSALDALLERRLNGEPIAYITESCEFWSIPLSVNASTLVPRADTEILVEKAIELAPAAPPGYILDLGTGSGAIAIALALELGERDIIAIDYSTSALSVAQENCRTLTNGNMHVVNASWMDCIASDSVAMVLSNPPYLAADDVHLHSLQHEPRQALVSGSTGLDDIAHIVSQTLRTGKVDAPLIIEHGYRQGADVRQLLLDHQYRDVGTEHDLAGHERISFGFVAKTGL